MNNKYIITLLKKKYTHKHKSKFVEGQIIMHRYKG